MPRVDKVTRVFWGKWGKALSGYMEFDDAFHVGVEAMLTCRARWNPELGASFSTFCSHRVMGALIDHVRDDKHIPINRASRQGDWLQLQPLADLDGGDEDRCLNTERQRPHDTKLLSSILATLYAREVEIIYLRYYEDVTLTEIGNKLGITESRVHQIHDAIIAKLKRRLMYPAFYSQPTLGQLVNKMVERRRRRCREQSERRINHV